ncbi:MAG: hydrogenase formation protein HypD [Chloroflexi bacterium]|nr:hydrogenase formation protein HypD [Chloroflexota bacterium]
MRYLDEFRDPELARVLVAAIRAEMGDRPLRLMEVCGSHTVAIFRSGVRQLLGGSVELLSGPGCPVCVTAQRDIDHALALAAAPGVTLATFGDMIKVPGARGSLQQARAAGADVRVVYAATDALRFAEANPSRQVVFLGIGFETTAPTVAASLLEARQRRVSNYYVFSVHKLVPPALRALLASGEVQLDGLILPGHVSAIIGEAPYRFLSTDYRLPAVITGFEPLDILRSILDLARLARSARPAVVNQYGRAVRQDGNPAALEAMAAAFSASVAEWRGLGSIPGSGLRLRSEFAAHDAALAFPVDVPASREPAGCACGRVLRGATKPPECPLFAVACTPERPVGPCMVSAEGACTAYYAYGRA